jgi:hypothetical protein
VLVGEFLELCRRQPIQDESRHFAEQAIAQAVQTLEVFEEQDQLLHVADREPLRGPVKRMCHCMREPLLCEVTLRLVEILADFQQFRVLRLADAPDQ